VNVPIRYTEAKLGHTVSMPFNSINQATALQLLDENFRSSCTSAAVSNYSYTSAADGAVT